MDQDNKAFYLGIRKHLSFLDNVSLNASGNDTVNLITTTINKYANSEFVTKAVAIISKISNNEFEFCKKLFEVVDHLVTYRADPEGHEIIFTPRLLTKVRKGDCKKFTVFICCCLKNKGINSASKVVNYNPGYGWQHIYAIAFYPNEKGYLTLDPVNHSQFNKEVKFRIGRVNFYNGTFSKLIMNKLSVMGNLNENNASFLGIGESSDDILGDLETISGHRYGHLRRPHLEEIEQSYINGVFDMPGISGEGIGKRHKRTKEEKAARKKKRRERRKRIFKGLKKFLLRLSGPHS